MKGFSPKIFLIITLISLPAFAQQGMVPASHPLTLSWGWLMTIGLVAGMLLGLLVRPRKITDSEQRERRDHAA